MRSFKNIFLSLLISITIVPCAYAFNPKYLVHTSLEDIEYKKKKALEWYSDNVEPNKFSMKDEVAWLKARSLRWYSGNVEQNKFRLYNIKEDTEWLKARALKWYSRNSH